MNIQLSLIYVFFSLSVFFILLFLYSLPKKNHPYLLYFGLFLTTMSINLLGVWQVNEAQGYSTFLKYASYGAGTFFLLFYEQIFGQGLHKINQKLWQLHLLCWGTIILLSLSSIVRLEASFFPYSILNIATVIFIAISSISKAHSGNNDAKIFTFGLLSLILTLIIDISLAIKISNYSPSQTTTWGLLVFTFCLTAILLKRYLAKGSEFIYETFTFQQDPIELKMKADSMVMHTLKNEINRLFYLNERSKRIVSSLDDSIRDLLVKNFELMDESLTHMNEMILAVKKTDNMVLSLRNQSFNEVVFEAVSNFQAGIGNSIELEVNAEDSIYLEIDPLHVKECILNLLSNCSEAIEHSNGKIRISLYRKGHESAVLEVSDNGKGIHPEHIQDVITPLFTTKKTVSHHSVGLYYVYYVINKHGGTFSIPYSELGKGTTIQIRIPLKKTTTRIRRVNTFEKNKSHAG
ncbi:ATP-binding protein [Bacillus sp. 1P10SD]|uniref:sensor histidine kinase n=1 Tax=Bacillus sp. 1P10SD TaxID=3132265 RepID=UPI0039A45217